MFKSFVALTVFAIAAVKADHTFIFNNQCGYGIQPAIANVNCGYSPRCNTPGSGGVVSLLLHLFDDSQNSRSRHPTYPNPAISYNGGQPGYLNPGQSTALTINRQWNGRIFAQAGCGGAGENCSITEFNLDTGDQWTPQSYDISNIQGFTQSIQIAVNGCDTVTCTNSGCPCNEAYPIGDTSGCGSDLPVRGCSAGDHTWTITFCP